MFPKTFHFLKCENMKLSIIHHISFSSISTRSLHNAFSYNYTLCDKVDTFIFVNNRRLKGLPISTRWISRITISLRREGEGRQPRDCNRSAANAVRRVIDNDNFVSAVPRTVLTSGLYLLHQAGGSYE